MPRSRPRPVSPPPPRPVPTHFTAEQRAFIAAVRDGTDHLVLRATAGSGKTTTLCEAAWHLDRSGEVVYFAYNKHAVVEVGERLPGGVRASTLHAYGRRVLCRMRGTSLDLEAHKSERLAQQVLVEGGRRPDRRWTRAVARLWDRAREYGLDERAHPDDLAGLVEDAEWPEPGDVSGAGLILRDMRSASLADWKAGGLPDFTDFLWLPSALNLAANSVRVALTDEVQDLTPLRQAFVMHLLGLRGEHERPGRFIAVGDPEQAIYTYAGADPRGMWRLARKLGARELPLSVSWRCPASHVALARSVSDFIRPSPSARAGVIEHVEAEALDVGPGDVLLCRLNAPLVRVALAMMARRVSVNIRGRDLATRLDAAMGEAFALPFREAEVDGLVDAYHERRAEPLLKRVQEGDDTARKLLSDLKDFAMCLRLLGRQVASTAADGVGRLEVLRALLASLYREDADVLLSTVHRAKGLEWKRVTILYPELMPSPHGDPVEEKCVQFVALTRSQEVLRLAYGREAWASGWRLESAPLPTEEAIVAEAPPPSAPARVVPEVPIRLPTGRTLPPVPAHLLPSPSRAGEATRPGPWAAFAPPLPAARPIPTVPAAPPVPPAPFAPPVPPVAWPQPSEARIPEVLPGVGPVALPRVAGRRPAQKAATPELVLFGGSDRLERAVLSRRLEALLDEPRLGLVAWARLALAQLGGVEEDEVAVNADVLDEVERCARVARSATPLSRPLGADEVGVVVIHGPVANLMRGQVRGLVERVVSVHVAGRTERFDVRTGEVLGEPFVPRRMYVQPDRLARLRRS